LLHRLSLRVTEWSDWSQCKGKDNCADTGTHYKTREISQRYKSACTEDRKETDSCRIQFDEWSEWSPCTAACGEKGSITRTRRNLGIDQECDEEKECTGACNAQLLAIGVSCTSGVIIIILITALILVMKKSNYGCFKKEENKTEEVAVDYYTVKKNDEEYYYEDDTAYGNEYDREYEENRQEAAYYSEDYNEDDREYENVPL